MEILGNKYEVKEIRRRDFELSNKGCIEAHLKGNFEYPWKRNVTEYYITVRMVGEDFDRTLVLTDKEYRSLFSE